jgi:hypothetical protein
MKQANKQQSRKRQEELCQVVRRYSRPPALKLYSFSADDPSNRVSIDVTDDPVAELVTGFKRHYEYSYVCYSFNE